MAKASTNKASVIARVAALPVIYVVTALTAACGARFLPMSRVEATVAATLASFAIFSVLVLTAFMVKSMRIFWLLLIGSVVVLTGCLALSLHFGGRA